MNHTAYAAYLEQGELDGLAAVLHTTALDKGFWDNEVDVTFILSKLALIHSEVSEVLEAVRKEQGEEAVVIELADILIRTLDLYAGLVDAGVVSVSLDEMMVKKLAANAERPHRHGVLA